MRAFLNSALLEQAARHLNLTREQITDVTPIKKGLTNRSFLLTAVGGRYVLRVPGEGTRQLIDRRQEAAVYDAIRGRGLCDDPLWLDPETGCKLTAYLEHSRVCDSENAADLERCMAKLRAFHRMHLEVGHRFDLFGQIEFYESLRMRPSVYPDYAETKARVLRMKPYIQANAAPYCLSHIDAVPDNFLFHPTRSGAEGLQLTDWEYAGMQDPHLDLAMFCVYSGYDRFQTDRLIDLYFEHSCEKALRIKIYCQIATAGLLWSNWCEYKKTLGVAFGSYALRQYEYARDYSRFTPEEWEAELR